MPSPHIAILIDGGFFLKRLPKLVAAHECADVESITRSIRRLCYNHVCNLTDQSRRRDEAQQTDTEVPWHRYVHRVFFYDAYPYDGKAHHPLDQSGIDFSKNEIARHKHELFKALRKQRKMALRLGKVTKERDWTLSERQTKPLLRNRQAMNPLARLDSEADGEQTLTLSPDEVRKLTELRQFFDNLGKDDVSLGLRQKGVDMRIGLDISSLALKKQVQTIVLVAGDSDFVPAAKQARREGVEFILDPLWQSIHDDLFEHIDGLQSGLPKPVSSPEKQPSETQTASGTGQD